MTTPTDPRPPADLAREDDTDFADSIGSGLTESYQAYDTRMTEREAAP